MNAVVYRHDRRDADERRHHVMRGVEDVDTQTVDDVGYRNLFGDRVRAGRHRDGAEVVTQLMLDAHIAGLAQQNVLGVMIEPRQLAEQVTDVGSDAKSCSLRASIAMRTGRWRPRTRRSPGPRSEDGTTAVRIAHG